MNRLTNSHIHILFKEYGKKRRTWKLRNIFNESRYKANCYQYIEEKTCNVVVLEMECDSCAGISPPLLFRNAIQ